MPLRLYREKDEVFINELDDPTIIVGRISKGQLYVPHEHLTWFNESGYPLNLMLVLYPIVMTMPEHFWLAIGEFENGRARKVEG